MCIITEDWQPDSSWGRDYADTQFTKFYCTTNFCIVSGRNENKVIKQHQVHISLQCHQTVLEYCFDQVGSEMLLLINNVVG